MKIRTIVPILLVSALYSCIPKPDASASKNMSLQSPPRSCLFMSKESERALTSFGEGLFSLLQPKPQRPAGQPIQPQSGEVQPTWFSSGGINLGTFIADPGFLAATGRRIEEKTLQAAFEIRKRHPEFNVDTVELASIRLYTSNLYKQINPALRKRDKPGLDHWEMLIKSAASGLNRLPPFQGSVTRGAQLPGEVLDRYLPGQTIAETAFLSTTAAEVCPEVYAGNVEFVINSRTGKKVDFISDFPEEKEVLFVPGTIFRVLERTAIPGSNGAKTRIVLSQE